ncbi:Helix-loop-helix DNA-binding domain [Geosmithia morbida]|uniref:Helix-loop-helix DNA-binding domain n=1 Tax=Geosmithia morbida TaxID=1094350 RepID=A0A9P4Z1L3_9HYPO|nr:Helix-loop-helix DNA-binding domain [Geosmithia morbida]KAF4126462.1 Helix-loop-helix DNA-binding domain [Geosmithia morbida]
MDPNQPPPMDPPAPPPGMPILSDVEFKTLDNFFVHMGSDQYNAPSFGEGLSFSSEWMDLPPQFMGVGTSYGHQDQPSPPTLPSSSQHYSNESAGFHTLSSTGSMLPPPPQFPTHMQQHQHHHHHQPHHQQQGQQHQQSPHDGPSEDVLHAAATLLHNNNNNSNNRSAHAFEASTSSRKAAVPVPVGHLRHQPLEEFQEEGRREASDTQQPTDYVNLFIPTQQRRPSRSSLPTDFQWGSDSNFSTTQGYMPEANKQTVESMHRMQLKLLDSLEVSRSAASTRPSSPSNNGHGHGHGQVPPLSQQHGLAPPTNNSNSDNHAPPSMPSKGPEDPEAPPRKRRKSRIKGEGGGGDDDVAGAAGDEDCDGPDTNGNGNGSGNGNGAKPGYRRRKSKVEPSSPYAGGDGISRKRRGTVNGAAAAAAAAGAKVSSRETLTEEQKRENHIRSEQKRRTLIKVGFDDLCEIVPALKGGGFSKSTMLSIAGEWLDDFLKGNKALEKQLASIGL